MAETVKTTLQGIRRLAVSKQHLAGRAPTKGTGEDIVRVVRDLGFVQWDPVSVVAPSHMISLWSRVGPFRMSDLESMLWKERRLLLHWTPLASIVLPEDYPIYRSLMKRYPDSLTSSWGAQRERAKKFLSDNVALKRRVLRSLEYGPRTVGEFGGQAKRGKGADGWTTENEASRMMFHLMMMGEVMVVGHRGNQNVWGLSERFLPALADMADIGEEEMELRAAERAIKGQGTATPSEIHFYFVRGRYQNLKGTLKGLEEGGAIVRVEVQGLEEREARYIHSEDLGLLGKVEGDGWEPRVTLISPFDNIICGRARARTVFGFDYVHEQFLPKSKRKFGTYVMPILSGERLVGRVDPKLDKEEGKLIVNSVHQERGAPQGGGTAREVAKAIADLGKFVGATDVEYTSKVPAGWRNALR